MRWPRCCLSRAQDCAKGKETLEESALHATVLQLYNQINMRIPRHIAPPEHEDVARLLAIFDDNGDGVMDEGEFVDFSVFLFYQVLKSNTN